MRLSRSTHQRRDTRDRDDASAPRFLGCHLVCAATCDVETAVEVYGLDFFPERVGHVEECVEGADAGVAYEDVDS
jgi:hypothetical protein